MVNQIELKGLFFNENQITSEDEPEQKLVIKKDVLDRSSKFIIGRFGFEIDKHSKIVFEVELDGSKIDDFGTNLPYTEDSGDYDTTLFKYPNSARANRLGVHNIHVKMGLITGIVESAEGLVDWKATEANAEADFEIELVA